MQGGASQRDIARDRAWEERGKSNISALQAA